MNTDTIIRLLQNSGFHGLRADDRFIYMEDPSCILRSFEVFMDYAWIVITALTGLLLFGWAISLIRGSKNDYFMNLRNLILIFGALSAAKPIINFIYGDDLFARGCKTISVSIDDMNKLLEMRKDKLSERGEYDLYEEFDIYDSGAVFTDETTVESVKTDEVPAPDVVPDTPSVEPQPVNIADVPTAAVADGKNVIYTLPNGERIKRVGGTRAWRNSNPGNIRYSDFSRRVGAIGQAGGFAVFPDEATGMYAIEALLRTDSYNKLTVAGAISRYAPPSENNTSAYHRQIEKLTGLSINKRMADLTPTELTRVANAIKQIEGWRVGTTQRI